MGIEETIRRGYRIFVIGGIVFALQMYLSPVPLFTSIISIGILTFGNGFLLPLGTASAIAAHPQASGTASGVMGALQLGSAALATFLIGKLSAHAPVMTALIIACVCVVGFLVYVFGQYGFMEFISSKESNIND